MTMTARTARRKLSSSMEVNDWDLRKYGSRTDMMTIGPTTCAKEEATFCEYQIVGLIVNGESPHAV